MHGVTMKIFHRYLRIVSQHSELWSWVATCRQFVLFYLLVVIKTTYTKQKIRNLN